MKMNSYFFEVIYFFRLLPTIVYMQFTKKNAYIHRNQYGKHQVLVQVRIYVLLRL